MVIKSIFISKRPRHGVAFHTVKKSSEAWPASANYAMVDVVSGSSGKLCFKAF
jgi:hypothetical protein